MKNHSLFVPHSNFVKWILVGNFMKWIVYYNNKQQNLDTVFKVAPYFSSIKLFSYWLLHSLIWPCCSCFSVTQLFLTLWPHRLQHTRLPCPSSSSRAFSTLCLLSQWCHLAISSSVIPFSSCLQSLPASGSFLMSWLIASGGQSIRASASASVSVLLMNI